MKKDALQGLLPLFSEKIEMVTVSAILDTRKPLSEKKYGDKNHFSVKIQVLYRRKRDYYVVGEILTPEQWERLPKAKSAEMIKARNKIFNTYEKIVSETKSILQSRGFEFEILAKRLEGKGATDESLNIAFRAKIDALRENHQLSSATAYDSALKAIEDYAGTSILIRDISSQWLYAFERHLVGLGRRKATIGIYMRNLRCVVKKAVTEGVIKAEDYPFGGDGYNPPKGDGRSWALSMEQLRALYNYDDGLEGTRRYKALWFFSYYCNGANPADILKLKFKDIIGGEITFVRQKTEHTANAAQSIRVTYLPEMQEIVKTYGNQPKPNNYLFPYLEGDETPEQRKKVVADVVKRINFRMNRIGKELGIGAISTYTARHTFATALKNSGQPVAFISEALGHGDIKTTQNYLSQFEKEARKEAAEKLKF